jgi:DNA-binding XRE family transcriptional regulator
MSRQALFASLLADAPDSKAELSKVAVAADLTVLLAQSGRTRSDLAKQLGWSRARVTQVLSGEGNLTIETVFAVAQALGQTFDIVFRKPDERRVPQAWERGVVMSLAGSNKVTHLSGQGGSPKAKAACAQAWSSPAKLQTLLHDTLQASEQAMEWAHAA